MRWFYILILVSIFFSLCQDFSFGDIPSVKKVDFDASGRRDPFKSSLPEERIEEKIIERQVPLEVPVSRPDIKIQGIVWGGPFPQAIINNQVTREGDSIYVPELVTILEIKPKKIAVLFKKKVFDFHP